MLGEVAVKEPDYSLQEAIRIATEASQTKTQLKMSSQDWLRVGWAQGVLADEYLKLIGNGKR